MELTARAFWLLVHLGLGALFLHSFAAGLAGLGMGRRRHRLLDGTWIMAATAWLTVITGTWIVYPWYRAEPPEGEADLAAYPKAYLLADRELAGWHTFAMEWKEHVGWLSPILATAVAYVVIRYRPQLAHQVELRRALMILFTLAFATAAVSGALGAFINKAAPNDFVLTP